MAPNDKSSSDGESLRSRFANSRLGRMLGSTGGRESAARERLTVAAVAEARQRDEVARARAMIAGGVINAYENLAREFINLGRDDYQTYPQYGRYYDSYERQQEAHFTHFGERWRGDVRLGWREPNPPPGREPGAHQDPLPRYTPLPDYSSGPVNPNDQLPVRISDRALGPQSYTPQQQAPGLPPAYTSPQQPGRPAQPENAGVAHYAAVRQNRSGLQPESQGQPHQSAQIQRPGEVGARRAHQPNTRNGSPPGRRR